MVVAKKNAYDIAIAAAKAAAKAAKATKAAKPVKSTPFTLKNKPTPKTTYSSQTPVQKAEVEARRASDARDISEKAKNSPSKPYRTPAGAQRQRPDRLEGEKETQSKMPPDGSRDLARTQLNAARKYQAQQVAEAANKINRTIPQTKRKLKELNSNLDNLRKSYRLAEKGNDPVAMRRIKKQGEKLRSQQEILKKKLGD